LHKESKGRQKEKEENELNLDNDCKPKRKILRNHDKKLRIK